MVECVTSSIEMTKWTQLCIKFFTDYIVFDLVVHVCSENIRTTTQLCTVLLDDVGLFCSSSGREIEPHETLEE